MPPDHALPAAEFTVQTAGFQAAPMMSFSPVRSTRFVGSVTWAVPRAPSSVPVPSALVNVWVYVGVAAIEELYRTTFKGRQMYKKGVTGTAVEGTFWERL